MILGEAKKLNDTKNAALREIQAEQRTIEDSLNDYRQIEAKYKDSNSAGAKIAKSALAELEKES